MCSKTKTIKSTNACWDNRDTGVYGDINACRDNRGTGAYQDNREKVRMKIKEADAILIGAGAGLSASAGFTYSGERFEENFPDFIEKYGFTDMYSAGFYPYKTLEEYWAYWSRYILINRYQDAPKNVYHDLYHLVQNKDYFVLTTNVGCI